MVENLKKFWFDKLLAPKAVIIDRPGIIYNILSKKYGEKGCKKRLAFYFEELMVKLHLDTIKEIGEEKTSKLWYKIGKDIGARYLLISKIQNIPKEFFTPLIKHIFDNFIGGGFSVLNKINYNEEEGTLIIEGKDNLFCRRTKDGAVFAGIISQVIGSILNEKMEGEMQCIDCPRKCRIFISKNLPRKYFPDIKKISPLENYEHLNFPKQNRKFLKTTFKDLLRFKKIKLDEKGMFNFLGKTIAPTEFGVIELISENYSEEGHKKIIEESIKKSSKELAESIINKKMSINKKIKFLERTLSGLGWGVPDIKKTNEKIIVILHYPPIVKYEYTYTIKFIEGFLEKIYNRRIEFDKLFKEFYKPKMAFKYNVLLPA